MLTHFSTFTGIGGIDLAAEEAGFQTVGQCEYGEYQTKVLEKHWPNVPRWRDIRNVTAESIRARGIGPITLLSGGFPCQPHSLAGKRLASDDERDLWDEFARVIREVKPKWILAENVLGLLSSENGRFFGRILRDLAGMGYNAEWCCYGAESVGAFHERQRVFIVSHSNEINGKTRLGIFKKQQTSILEKDYRKLLEIWIQASSGIIRINHGISREMDRYRIECLGNAVVPQQVYPILKCIAEIEGGKTIEFS